MAGVSPPGYVTKKPVFPLLANVKYPKLGSTCPSPNSIGTVVAWFDLVDLVDWSFDSPLAGRLGTVAGCATTGSPSTCLSV